MKALKKTLILGFIISSFAGFAFAGGILPVSASASSFEPKDEVAGKEFAASMAIDGDMNTRWSSNFRDGEWITLDFGKKAAIDKIILYWEAAFADTYQIQLSNNNRTWYVAGNITKDKGGKKEINFNPVECRYVRMYGVYRGSPWGFSLFEFEVYKSEKKDIFDLTKLKKPDEIVYSTKDLNPKPYYKYAAETSPKGYYPRTFRKEQMYWTIVGSPESEKEALLSEDGMLDFYDNGFSLIPYIYTDGKLYSSEMSNKVLQGLENEYLPIPFVKCIYDNMMFTQKVFADTKKDDSGIYASYKIKNTSDKKISGKFYVTIRPFQVNPEWMYGGFVEIESISELSRKRIAVNNKYGLYSVNSYDSFGAISFEDGDIMHYIQEGKVPKTNEAAADKNKFANGAIEYSFSLKPREEEEFMIMVPVDREISKLTANLTKSKFAEEYAKSKIFWEEKLNKVQISIPQQKEISNVLKTNLAYILISKDGPGIQPGSRNYDRTWMRDGAVMAASLLRTGHFKEVREYIDWVTTFQKDNGRVPPIIYSEGYVADKDKNLNEHDAQGEYVFLVSEYYRFTKDKEFLKSKFQNVLNALKHMDDLRKTRLTDEYKNAEGEKRGCYGILPESISHEGYSEPGKHSYWDDYWGLKGLEEAQFMAKEIGRKDVIKELKKQEEDFRKCVVDSIEYTRELKNIQYIPGCPELGDEDAISVSISVWPTDQYKYLDQASLMFTLNKFYHKNFLPRLKDGIMGGYTPYEFRAVIAYTVLGKKEEALRMFNYYFNDMRPRNWNAWGEVVYQHYREPRYLGDLPHSWEGGIYINMVRSMFILEREDKIVLFSVFDPKWLEGEGGVSLLGMPTYYGIMDLSVKKEKNIIKVKVSGNIDMPKEGIIIKPMSDKFYKVMINGKRIETLSGNDIRIDKLPSDIEIHTN